MPLKAGTSLGPYEIDAPLGAGGMGEVYKARDTRLDRTVAIKVLPEHVAADPDLKQRFEREAKTVAALSHPHICPVFDVGEQDGVNYLVMEYLDGETLQQRLEKGALPLDQALTVAIEIADALDKAHRQGIVHRDLKPGNIMLTKAGAKLLDFGLAKLKPVEQSGGLSALPTQGAPLTQEGSILGTFQYMSPEQLEGQEADTRTDIFAFGAVVYEMVTGKKAFEGKSQASLIAAIMNTAPTSMVDLDTMMPRSLDHVVTRCLAKDPIDRWQAASDVARELQWVRVSRAEEESAVAPTGDAGAASRLKTLAVGFLLGAVAASIALFTLVRQPSDTQVGPIRRALVPVEADLWSFTRYAVTSRMIAISPNGSNLAYVVESDGQRRLAQRWLDQRESQILSGTEGAFAPFFSPDGEWIGFFSGNQLRKIRVQGGGVSLVSVAPNSVGGTWLDDSTIVFAERWGAQIMRVSEEGGSPELVLGRDAGEWLQEPQALPGSQGLLISVHDSLFDKRVDYLALDTGERRTLVERAGNPQFVPTGHLLYTVQDGIMAMAFDSISVQVSAPAIPVLEDVRRDDTGIPRSTGMPQFAVSSSGLLAYVAGEAVGLTVPTWVDRDGRQESELPIEAGLYGALRLSPSGRLAALTIDGPTSDIWIYDSLREGGLTPLRVGGAHSGFPVWKDENQVAFFQTAAGGEDSAADMFIQGVAGTTHERVPGARPPDAEAVPYSWSRDSVLAFEAISSGTFLDIWTLSDDGSELQPFVQTEYNETLPAFSPNGRYIVYESDETGKSEIYVKRYPPTEDRWHISTAPGPEGDPIWSGTGDEIFFQKDQQWFAVGVDEGAAELNPGAPEFLFEGPYREVGGVSYDVTPDGRRFLVLKEEAVPIPEGIQIVTNWFEELKARVPTGN